MDNKPVGGMPAAKQKKKLPKWLVPLVVVCAIVFFFAVTCTLTGAAGKSAAQRILDSYISAAKKQNVNKCVGTLEKKGTEGYTDLRQKYSDGKSQWKDFVAVNSPESEEYKAFFNKTTWDWDNPLEYGLKLQIEQTLAKNIDSYEFTLLRQEPYYVEISVTLTAKEKLSDSVLPKRYLTKAGGQIMDQYTIKVHKVDGQWKFNSGFCLAWGNDDIETWFAPYGDGVELKHVNSNDLTIVTKDGVIADVQFDVTKFTDKPVLSIGNLAFASAGSVRTVTLHSQTQNIGKYAFGGCEDLTSVALKDADTGKSNPITAESDITFNEGAFYGCKNLVQFTLPQKNTIVPAYMFYNCAKLASFTVNPGTTAIGYYAFAGCKALASIDIIEGIRVIGDGAFEGCEKLATLSDKKSGNVGNLLPSSLISIGADAFKGCTNSIKDTPVLTDVALPDSIKIINSGTFANCTNLKNVIFPKDIEQIGNGAFKRTGFTSLSVPQSLLVIGKNAFDSCSNLETIDWQGQTKIRTIGDSAFLNCVNLYKLVLPSTVKSIGGQAFLGCTNLRYVTMNCSASTLIGDKSFAVSDGIPKFYIPSDMDARSFKSLPAWQRLSVEIYSQGIIKDNMAILEETSTDVNGVTVREKVLIQYLGDSEVVNLDSASGITRIGSGAFSHNTQIKEFNFDSDKIIGFGSNVFNGCTALNFDAYESDDGKAVYLGKFNGSLSPIESDKFDKSESKLLYLGNWLVYGNEFLGKALFTTDILDLRDVSVLPQTVGIAAQAFSGSSIVDVLLPKSLKYICEQAYGYSSSLVSVSFEQNSVLNTIEDSAFLSCDLFDSIELPASLKEIGDRAFDECRVLRFIIINNSDKILLGENAFKSLFDTLKLYIKGYGASSYYAQNEQWKAYSDITFSTDTISGDYAVREISGDKYELIQFLGRPVRGATGNSALVVDLSKSVGDISRTIMISVIGPGAFAASAITDVILGTNIQRIEQNAFNSCEALAYIQLLANADKSSSLEYMGDYAFSSCKQFIESYESRFDIEPERPHPSFSMGKYVFDDGLFRKVWVGKRSFFETNSYWKEYSDLLAAYDDPSLVVQRLIIGGEEEYHKNNTINISQREGEPIFRASGAAYPITATYDNYNGYEFVGWFKWSDANLSSIEGLTAQTTAVNLNYIFGEPDTEEFYYAVFRRVEVWVTVASGEGGRVDGRVDGQLWDSAENKSSIKEKAPVGKDIVFTAVPETNNTNYVYGFDGWYRGEELLSTDLTYTHRLDDKDYVIEAKFKTIEVRLTISASSHITGVPSLEVGGTITSVDFTITNNSFSGLIDITKKDITLEAQPNAGYAFRGWYLSTGERLSGNAVFTFDMSQYSIASHIQAWFRKEVAVTIESSANGTVATQTGTHAAGDTIKLESTASEGFKLEGWYLVEEGAKKLLSKDATYIYTINIETNITIRAEFKEAKMLTIICEGGSCSLKTGLQVVGEDIKLSYSTNDNYEFVGWYRNGTLVGTDSFYEFRMPDEDITIVVKFKKLTSSVTIRVGTVKGGKIDYTTSGSNVAVGTEIELTAITSPGYEFVGWFIVGKTEPESTSASYTYIVGDDNVIIEAIFKAT